MSDSETNTTEQSTPDSNKNYGQSALVNAYTLGAFAIAAALILGSVYVGTKDRIEASRILAEQQALLQVIGDFPHDNDLITDTLELTLEEQERLNSDAGSDIYVIRYQSKTTGFIFPTVAPDGYSGDISMLVGVSISGDALGVRVVEHKETPGLGDKVDEKKSDWILGFAGKSLVNPSVENWAVTKDGGEFDAFTGATITPRAAVNRVKAVLEYFESAREALLERAELTELMRSENEVATNGQ